MWNAGKKIIDHSDVVGTSPVGAAPATSSFSTTPGVNGLGKGKCNSRQTTFRFLDLVLLYKRFDGTHQHVLPISGLFDPKNSNLVWGIHRWSISFCWPGQVVERKNNNNKQTKNNRLETPWCSRVSNTLFFTLLSNLTALILIILGKNGEFYGAWNLFTT